MKMENIKLFCFNSKTVKEIITAVKRSAKRIIIPPKKIAINIWFDRLKAMFNEYIPNKKFNVEINPPAVTATVLLVVKKPIRTPAHPAKTEKETRKTTK